MPFTDKITFRKKQTVLLPLPLPDKYLPRPTPSPPSLCPSLLSGLFAFPIFFPLPFPIFVFCRRFLFHRDLFTFQAHQLSGSPFLALLPDAPAPLRFFTLSRHSSDTCLLSRHFLGTCLVPQHGTIFLPIKKTPSASGSGVLKDKKMIIYAVLANATATSLSLLNRRTANDT